MTRIPITRTDADGSVIDGTAALVERDGGGFNIGDFRDLDGEPLSLPPGSRFDVTTDLELPAGVDPGDLEVHAMVSPIDTYRALFDPDDPAWPWRHAPRRSRRLHAEIGRYQMELLDAGVPPHTDLRYNELMAESWRESARSWRRNIWWGIGLPVFQVAVVGYEVISDTPLWVIGLMAALFGAIGAMTLVRVRTARLWRAESERQVASFEEQARILAATS